ncbi:MAG: MiaB/RimO family radical SAM methylthiotransferase [Patescibacteria group bacterium]|jgi:tRNA-2-methylthio-N6-dimethylallyladenosine synthase
MKYYLFTIGCQMNWSDAERLASILQSHDCEATQNENQADLIIVVSCSVRQKAMDRIFGSIEKWRLWKKERPLKLILTGCVLPADRIKLQKDFDIFLEIKDIAGFPQLLGLDKKLKTKETITNADYLSLDALHSSPFQAFIPIMTGCNNYCTYCAVPYTRGQEASRPSSDIINEVKNLINQGYKEITLLGQNVNAYIDPEKNHDKDILESRSRDYWRFKKGQAIQWRTATTKVPKDFSELLIKINSLPGNFWIRFLTSNPQDVSEELLKTLPQCEKMTRFFHLPIQSGDDEILRRMNRRHNRRYYLDLIKRLRAAWPGVAITTDVIVGFPGETNEQFQQTAELMKTVKYDMAYLAQYSPRLGTAAARFFPDDVPKKTKMEREKILNDILAKTALENNKKLIGTTQKVLIDKRGRGKNVFHGKTEGFKTVEVISTQDLIGQFINVKIEKASAWGLAGKLDK